MGKQPALPKPAPHGGPETPARGDRWQAIEADPDFQLLVAAKRRFIVPATLFFILYYFALPILVGYFPKLMETNLIGKINFAYLFALSQFFVAWTIAYLYVRRSNVFDVMAAKVVEKAGGATE